MVNLAHATHLAYYYPDAVTPNVTTAKSVTPDRQEVCTYLEGQMEEIIENL